MTELAKPGLLGLALRAGLAIVVLLGLYDAVRNPTSYWDGFADPLGALPLFLPLILLSGWVINELLQTRWRWWPNLVLVVGAGIAMIVGSVGGDPWGTPIGYYVWTWQLLFTGLLGPAFLLAVIMRTPGCEMRSYAHLWTKIRGGDPRTVVCPGWIDRLDAVRVLGRF